jgi:hypothetical protein
VIHLVELEPRVIAHRRSFPNAIIALPTYYDRLHIFWGDWLTILIYDNGLRLRPKFSPIIQVRDLRPIAPIKAIRRDVKGEAPARTRLTDMIGLAIAPTTALADISM